MSRPEHRRQFARILTEFPLVMHDEQGVLLDDHALAHDVSDKGFKVESNGVLREGQSLRFQIQLDKGHPASGHCRVVWVERTDLAFWAGVEFSRLSWANRRRLRRLSRPANVDWAAISDKAITAVLWLTATLAIWDVLTSYIWRCVLSNLAPKALATLALGWALREMLRHRR